MDDDEVDESFIEDNESHSQASDVEVSLQKYGFFVVDGNNLALDIARTTDYGDNWAFKNYGPIHHRDEEHVDLQPFTLMAAMWYKGEKRYVATQRVLAASPIRR